MCCIVGALTTERATFRGSSMRDPHDPPDSAPEVVRLTPSRAENARALYVINLCASTTPIPLEMPEVHGFFGLAVFRSRRVEDGRDRYRLHLGYFESRADAERALPDVQRHYPTAWIAAAPKSGLGSLDDTNVSEFRLIHSPARRIQADVQAGEIPIAAPQRYVVQLVWSDKRVDPNEIPQLAIYDAYTMYTVTLKRGGVRLYGIRLGFFTSVISAWQIALYVRPDFPAVAVVPVSSREFDVARTIAWHRDLRTVAGAQDTPEPTPTQISTPIANPTPTAVPVTAPSAASEQSIASGTIAPVAAQAEQTTATTLHAASVAAPARADAADDVVVVSAKLVRSTPRKIWPDVAPESAPPVNPSSAPPVASEPQATPVSVVESVVARERKVDAPRPSVDRAQSATMAMREESRRRNSAFSREELLSALASIDPNSPATRSAPSVESAARNAGANARKRQSALRRFLHRLTNRLS